MESQGKAKVALTFALYQGEQLVRRETVAQDIVKVGKDARSHLRVDDDLASRMHAVIEVAGPQDITLIDLGNEPGTLVNTQRVNKCKVRPGDHIQIGSTVIVLESAEVAAVSAAPRPSAAPVSAPVGYAPGGMDQVAAHVPPAAPTGFAAPAFAGNNPFAASANPFAGAGTAQANPFAAGNNPFAAPSAPAGYDPALAAAAVPAPGSDPYAYAAGGTNGHAQAAWADVAAPSGPVGYSLLRTGPAINPDDVEIAHLAAIEVMIIWGDNVLHVSHLTPPRNFYVGEELSAKKAPCDFYMPAEALGTSRAPIVVASGGGSASLLILPGCTGEVEIPHQGRVDLATIVESRKARPSSEVSGAFEFELPAGSQARMTLPHSGITFQVSAVNAGRPVPIGFFATLDTSAFLYTGLSFLLHMGLVAIFAFFMPHMDGDDGEAIDNDQLLLMQKLLNAAAEREQEEQQQPQDNTNADNKEGGTGTRSKGEEGSMGNPNTKETGHKYGVQGPKDNPDPHLARQAAMAEAANFGMIGLLAAMGGGDPNAPTAPWGREESSGADEKSARGNMFGDAIGDAFGNGGLGLTGLGEGGGGTGEGIGLGNIGGLGHGAGTGTGQGIGNGSGGIGKGHRVKSPGMRVGNVAVNGRIPPEVIQRIVRQNQGRYRLCYENGLRSNPNLQGRVAVKFVIDRTGAVVLSADGGSDMPDSGVVSCVVSSFRNLSFPQPEGGQVTVTYPLFFTPPSDG